MSDLVQYAHRGPAAVVTINRPDRMNALNQAAKEVGQRFDFKGTGAAISWRGDDAVEISANSDDRVRAVLDVFKERLVKRSVSLKALDHGDPQPAAGGQPGVLSSRRRVLPG